LPETMVRGPEQRKNTRRQTWVSNGLEVQLPTNCPMAAGLVELAVSAMRGAQLQRPEKLGPDLRMSEQNGRGGTNPVQAGGP
jgi:hypothetical protein